MSQIVEQPTRGDNTLDLIAVNNVTLVNRTETLPGISDHEAVFAEIDIRPKWYGQAKRRIPLYKKADWEGIASQITITNQYIQDHANSESTDSLQIKFKSDLHATIEKHIPHKSCSSRNRSHGFPLRYVNYLRQEIGYIVRVNKLERTTKRISRTNYVVLNKR